MGGAEERSRAGEASRWFTVMTREAVDPEDLRAFVAWRREPANAAAFSKVQRAWALSEGLAERPWVAAATEAALAKYPARRRFVFTPRRFALRPLALGAVAVALVAALGWAGWRAMTPMFATGVGEQRLAVLSDGSSVRLNTDSRVRVAYRGGERRVVLEQGEAVFDVAHDAARPFVVVADGARVRALGTRFDVRREGREVRVTLLRGAVEVRAPDGETARLAPGQAVTAGAAGVSAPRRVDAAAAAGWVDGTLTFSGVPLGEAVAEMNRYSRRKIVLQAPAAVAAEEISGQFVAGDVDAFVAGARSLYGLQVVEATPREIRLARE